MTDSEAKAILGLYRPGTADAGDPSFAEALAECERNPELKRWFAGHCALYSALRAKFKEIPIPEGLKEQIVAERQAHPPKAKVPVWQKAVILAGAVAAVITILIQIQSNWQPPERHDFAAYSKAKVGSAIRAYGMQYYSSDLDKIQQFFVQTNAIANYVVPENLKKNATVVGCVADTWQGKKVSMICFRTGRPLKPGSQSDLWLFVADRSITTDTPTSAIPTPENGPESGVVMASWTIGNRTYVLATEGDKQFLSQFL